MKSPPDPSQAHPEVTRRKAVIDAGGTDRQRWEDARQLEAAWDQRAERAASHVPPGSAVLDLGCGAMAVERFLPAGCRYQPCDLTARDARTLVCDFNAGEFPTGQACDVVTILGVLEYLYDVPAFLAKVRALNASVVMSYCLAGAGGPADRRALGWVNDLTQGELSQMVHTAGFSRMIGAEITPGQFLLCFEPVSLNAPAERTVWVMSYNNVGNFGDRLGAQVLSHVLPPNANVRHVHHHPWDAPPEGAPDLLVLGIGNSLFQPLLTDDLLRLVDRAGATVGIFGTQYREAIDRSRMSSLLDRLEIWWARHEVDVDLFGAGRAKVRHLGDWMIDAFPMATWRHDELFKVEEEVGNDTPLDRLIERYQSYRKFGSPRMHPLLCALTAAEHVAHQEQKEMGGEMISGKFGSMLLDIFGADKPQNRLWPVDRGAVVAYKTKVRENIDAMRAELARLLG